MPFQVTIDDQRYLTDDLSLNEAIAVEEATGESWVYINPFRSAKHCKAIMVAFLARQMTAEEAKAKVEALSLDDAFSAIKVVDDDLPDEFEDGLPKAGDEPSTPTSPSSDDPPTAGPQP